MKFSAAAHWLFLLGKVVWSASASLLLTYTQENGLWMFYFGGISVLCAAAVGTIVTGSGSPTVTLPGAGSRPSHL